MATVLRSLSYQYPLLYDTIAAITALAVGGAGRFRRLGIEELPLASRSRVLDLCCGGGQATQALVQRFDEVVGLDASPRSLQRATQQVPQAQYIQGFAESMPLASEDFDLVHTSAACHEMDPPQLRQIFAEIYRVLKPQGYVAIVDFHRPTQPLMWPGLALFFWLFETQTSWQFIDLDLSRLLEEAGFQVCRGQLYAGGTLQVIQAQKVA